MTTRDDRMNDPFYGFVHKHGHGVMTMSVNGLTCTLNMPRKLESEFDAQGNEISQGLPPYNRRVAFLVDEYPASPANWMRSSAHEASFFVPVMPEHGLWLDFNDNPYIQSHHIAVVVSIQGLNAITGMKTDNVRLEQYRERCPKHDHAFGAEHFCEKCGYKWPPQNYLASNATPHGLFWLDGFRAADGKVRQFYFTEEMMKGVAAQILGEERVFAIGIAFFQSKAPKPQPVYPRDHVSWDGIEGAKSDRGYKTRGVAAALTLGSAQSMEVAAGARIHQQVYQDPEKLDFWGEELMGVIYINYVDAETAQAIVSAGRHDLTAGGEGFLKDINKGA